MNISRKYCPRCQKPLATCFCKLIEKVDNQTEIIIWQHPSESNHPKGTATLLDLCLSKSKIIIGEQLSPQKLGVCIDSCALLYPEQSTQTPSHTIKSEAPSKQLIIIDGTWRKSRKIVFCNPWLQCLTRLTIPLVDSNYTIRKPEKEHQLSTFEATAWALHALESDKIFKNLMGTFEKFIDQQKNYMPSNIQ